MIGDPVGAIARQDAAGYFHAGRRAETLLRSQLGERHSCIEIQVGDVVAAHFYATNEGGDGRLSLLSARQDRHH